jgi:hypothetical protein
MSQLVPIIADRAPALVAAVGERASYRFFEFFTAQIRNPHTRRTYARAAQEFFAWLEARGVTQLTAIESVHVAAYVEPVLCSSLHRRPLLAGMMTLYAPGSSIFDHGSRHGRVADYLDFAGQAIGSRGYDRAS